MAWGIKDEAGVWIRVVGDGGKPGRIVPYATAELAQAACKPGQSVKRLAGFATASSEEVRAYARQGGHAAQARGTAHKFDSEEGRAAGRLGGAAARAARTRAGS